MIPASSRRSFFVRFRRFVPLLAYVAILPTAAQAIEFTTAPTIAPATNGLLARVLNFTTDVPTRPSLRVQGPGEAWMLQSDVLRTEHSIPLMGFTFSSEYQVDSLNLTDADGNAVTLSDTFSIQTASAPQITTHMVETSIPSQMEPGITLVPVTGHTIGVDAQGTIRWHLYGTAHDIHLTHDGNYMARIDGSIREFDLLGNVSRAWYTTGDVPNSIPANAVAVTESEEFHHDASLIASNGNVLTLVQSRRTVDNFPLSDSDPNAGRGTAEIISDVVLEIDTAGTVVGRWDLADMLDPNRMAYGNHRANSEAIDWSHSNAVFHDSRDDSIIVSVRNQDAVIKFSRSTGELEWILGPHENWGPEFQDNLLTPVGDEFEWPYHTHAPAILPNGNLLVHDNGNFRASPYDEPQPDNMNYTRAVEYAINEETMEVTQVWQYGKEAEEVLYTPIVGDVDLLNETGNVLITFGQPTHVNHQVTVPIRPRVIEVDREGNVVFDLSLVNPDGSRLIVYRSERIPSLYGPDYTVTMLPVLPPAGDYNGNGVVEQADLDLVLLNWGQAGTPNGWTNDLPEGDIDQEELDGVLLNWGNAGSVAAVPEPSTLILLVSLAACALLGRHGRRRAT
jgi:hypothetical protein